MLLRFFSVLIICLFLCLDALAEGEIKRVAVLEFRGVAIEEAMLLKLSDQARAAAVDTLGKEEYLIMTRENMMQILSDMGKDASCIEGSCEVETGRNIGADLIITGDTLKIESSYVLTLKLFETQTGGLLKLKEVRQESLLVLNDDTYTQSVLLLQEGLDMSGDALEDWQQMSLPEIKTSMEKKIKSSDEWKEWQKSREKKKKEKEKEKAEEAREE